MNAAGTTTASTTIMSSPIVDPFLSGISIPDTDTDALCQLGRTVCVVPTRSLVVRSTAARPDRGVVVAIGGCDGVEVAVAHRLSHRYSLCQLSPWFPYAFDNVSFFHCAADLPLEILERPRSTGVHMADEFSVPVDTRPQLPVALAVEQFIQVHARVP